MLPGPSLPQSSLAQEFTKQVDRDLRVLSGQPALAVWRRSHPQERVQFAHYNLDSEPYQVDFERMNRWCAASIDSPSPVARSALFYVPPVRQGALPPLPVNEGARLRDDCQLQAIWYKAPPELSWQAMVQELSTLWGKPNGSPFEPDIVGDALWTNQVAWHHSGTSLWVAISPSGTLPTSRSPGAIVYARHDMARDDDVMDRWFAHFTGPPEPVMKAAARIAALDPALTARMLDRRYCNYSNGHADPVSVAAAPLASWLRSSKDLPTERKAAALLIADAYLACARTSYSPENPFRQLGAKYEPHCPQDGPDFSHNFRAEAEQIDPSGVSGELAAIAILGDPCSLKGSRPWPDLVIERGEKMLARFPENEWTPYLHFALARAHDAKLSFAYPEAVPEVGRFPLAPSLMKQERQAAIREFRKFLQAKPAAPEAVFAWQEAWRLLADLPPSEIHFGCGCE